MLFNWQKNEPHAGAELEDKKGNPHMMFTGIGQFTDWLNSRSKHESSSHSVLTVNKNKKQKGKILTTK